MSVISLGDNVGRSSLPGVGNDAEVSTDGAMASWAVSKPDVTLSSSWSLDLLPFLCGEIVPWVGLAEGWRHVSRKALVYVDDTHFNLFIGNY